MYQIFLIMIILLVVVKKFDFLPSLIYWKAVDVHRHFTVKDKPLHLYGIWCFVGIYGGGKTMSLVEYLERMRRKHKGKILIATNFYYKHQDFEIKSWKDLLPEYDRPVIYAYDELQNEFNSRDYKDFPVSLMVLLTQNRKKNGKQIVYTTQDYETVDKNFRRLTSKVVTCRTFFSRLTCTRYYDREDYDWLLSTVNIDRKVKIKPKQVYKYVQTDCIRSLYNSYQMLETAKMKQYNGIVPETG